MGPGKYFMESERLGFRIWNEDDFDLALELWGNFEVTKYFDSRGRFSDAMVFERLKNEIEMEKLYKVQYWPFSI